MGAHRDATICCGDTNGVLVCKGTKEGTITVGHKGRLLLCGRHKGDYYYGGTNTLWGTKGGRGTVLGAVRVITLGGAQRDFQ